MTGVGRAGFNIGVGTLLFLNSDILSTIAGCALIASGLILLYLSKVKNMSDVELNRAMSVYASDRTSYLRDAAPTSVNDSAPIQPDYSSSEVIAQVSHDSRDSYYSSGYDSRHAIGDSYREDQNWNWYQN